MFKNQQQLEGDNVETIIGPSVQVEGNFVANGDIVIEGVVSGNIKTAKSLRVGPNAKIFANISAASATVAGEIQGNVKVRDSLELASTSKIFGDIKSKILNISAGAVIHGKCQVGDERKAKFEKIEDIEKPESIKEVLKPAKPQVALK